MLISLRAARGKRVNRAWTPERVREELIAAFRHRPDTGIYSPRKGDLAHAIADGRLVEWDIIAATYHALGRDETPKDRETRLMVLTWARVMAQDTRQRPWNASLREICAERGWNGAAFHRRVEAGLVAIAKHLEAVAVGMRTVTTLSSD
jgi:hypothetical protein